MGRSVQRYSRPPILRGSLRYAFAAGLLLAATIIELTVLVAVGHAIGVLATVGLLVLASLVGAVLLRRESARTLAAFVEAIRTRRPPHQELLDGTLIATAGVLIVLPGFVSDISGSAAPDPPPPGPWCGARILRSASRRTPVRFAPGAVVEGEVVGLAAQAPLPPEASSAEPERLKRVTTRFSFFRLVDRKHGVGRDTGC